VGLRREAALRAAARRAGPCAALAALTAAALALRLWRLGFEPLWFDEAYSALASAHALGELLALVRREGSAPLYYVGLHAWRAAFGDSELSLRLPSALAGAAAVPVLHAVGRRLFGPGAGWIAAGLACVSPLHVHLSQEARMYPWVALAALALLVASWRLLEAPRPAAALAFAAALVVGLYLHYFFLFLAPLAACAWLAPERRRSTALAAGALGLAAIGFAPWLATFRQQAQSPLSDWIGEVWQHYPLAYALPWSLEVLGPGAQYPPFSSLKLASGAHARAVSLALAACVLAGTCLRLRRHADERRALGLVLAALLAPLVGALAVSVGLRPIYVVGRYDLIAWGPYLLLAGAVFSRLRAAPRAAIVGLWLALSLYTLWPHFRSSRDEKVYAARGDRIASRLLAVVPPGDLVVFPAGTRTVTDYYLREQPVPFGRVSFPIDNDAHLGWIDSRVSSDREHAAAQARRLAEAALSGPAPPGAVWVVAPASLGTNALLAELRARGWRPDAARSQPDLACLVR
jgi:4-amino-4-deoxy-L-arabinose transferase-like glycosyltransferase